MPFERLLEKLSSKNPPAPQRFLAIEITPETVKTAVWQVTDAKTHIITLGDIKDWDGKIESLLAAVDESLSQALENIDPEPNQAILGLPDSWVSGTNINQEGKDLLKTLSQKLEIKFIGFVVNTEAIIHELRRQEGTPLTAVLLNLTETEVGVQVVHLGQVLGNELVGRSEDLSADVEEGLARLKLTQPLPARMILTNGHLDLESARQTLLSYNWQDRLNFLHVPKIDILDRHFSIKAVAHSGGTEAAKSLGLEIVDTDQAPAETPSSDLPELPPAPGFQTDDSTKPLAVIPSKPPETKVIESPSPKTAEEEQISVPARKLPSLPSISFSFFRRLRLPLISRLNLAKLSLLTLQKQTWFIAAGLGLLLVLLFLLYWNIPQATVTLYLKPQTLEQELQLTADPQAAVVDTATSTIPAQPLDIKVDGALERPTSVETLVGDKATGIVTIYNKTFQAKTFPQGTVLTGPKDLKFTLDQEVIIASQSSTTEGITFGKADVSITAAQIGTESNLDANTQFTIENFSSSSYSALNSTALSGGTSKTAKVVAKSDQEALLKDLISQLSQKAKEKLTQNLSSQETLLDTNLEPEILKQQFSKAVSEEADQLSLTMRLKLTSYKVKKTDLEILLLSKLQDSIPDNFRLDPNNTNLRIKEAIVNPDATVDLTATAKVSLIPQLDIREIKDQIKGRYPEVTQNYFQSLPNYDKVNISITPKLPPRLSTLPRRTDRITIEIRVRP